MTETGFVPQARYMMRALELAAQAAAMGEVPVGAVVVQKSTGRIIGEGYNRREADRSPLAHAEIMAIDAASRTLGGWRLLDSALYVTLKPAPCVRERFCMPVWNRWSMAQPTPRAGQWIRWNSCSLCPTTGHRRYMPVYCRRNVPRSCGIFFGNFV